MILILIIQVRLAMLRIKTSRIIYINKNISKEEVAGEIKMMTIAIFSP